MEYVYLYMHPAYGFLYIGRTSNLKRRIRTHDAGINDNIDTRYNDLLQESSIFYLELNNKAESISVESLLINKHKPMLNKTLKYDGEISLIDVRLPKFHKFSDENRNLYKDSNSASKQSNDINNIKSCKTKNQVVKGTAIENNLPIQNIGITNYEKYINCCIPDWDDVEFVLTRDGYGRQFYITKTPVAKMHFDSRIGKGITYDTSEIREYLNTYVYDKLPDSVRKIIKPTCIHISDYSGEKDLNDKLFLLSSAQVYGDRVQKRKYVNGGECDQLSCFDKTTLNSKLFKADGRNVDIWLRDYCRKDMFATTDYFRRNETGNSYSRLDNIRYLVFGFQI